MCLCLAEWLVPTSREGWIAHIRGIGRMMEMCGPESFARPVSHQLFIGFRPLVILEACISRQVSAGCDKWSTMLANNNVFISGEG
ncbi:hypothetical protein CBS147346_1351 [Aspergillus niger]|nr:hypothetical protein CBS147346_1351 [Aspergillus niger]